MWERLYGEHVSPQVLGTADGEGAVFPMRIAQTQSVSSESNYSIQLADVLAGLVTKLVAQPRDEAAQRILEGAAADGPDINLGGVNYEQEFVSGPPRRLEGPDVVDRFSEILFPS